MARVPIALLPLPMRPFFQRSPLSHILPICVAAMIVQIAPATSADLSRAKTVSEVHAIAMHGTPLYPPGFTHFSCVNPRAPKGGEVTFAAVGSFDSLNPFVVKGVAALGVGDLVYESLLERSYDEPFTLYALLARKIILPDDRSFVTFILDSRARFSDGKPVTADDVIFSWRILKDKGRLNHRTYYRKVVRVERPDPQSVRFVFADGSDRELLLILGLMPVLPKHRFEHREFTVADLSVPVGSGPYVVEKLDPGRSITFRRNPHYWGRDLAVKRGRHNFDFITYDYYRDGSAAFEAFKAGQYDVRLEDNPLRWRTGYDFPALREGRVLRDVVKAGVPSGLYAFVFNTRRPMFADSRVRQALALIFDFEWTNATLYYGAYRRTGSYFDNSELSARGRPASATERALLAPFADEIPAHILNRGFEPPKSDGTGHNRENRRQALALLKSAGFTVVDGILHHKKSGQTLHFEIMLTSAEQEKLALTYAQTLKGIGIQVSVRTVDISQYEQRRKTYDFDMILNDWYASLSPGNEQLFYWSSQAAHADSTRNYPGIASRAVDASIAALLAAREREDFVEAARALDRALMAGFYFVPLFYQPDQWLSYWSHIGVPETYSLYGYRADSLWDKRAKQR
jgi:peptide/nickel transport system substrate-binding protein